jgi:hypothetical protein
MSTVCQRNKEKKRNTYLRVKNGVEILFRCWVIKICVIFLPPSLFSASQFRGWISRPRPDSALSPHVNSAESRRGGVGGGLGSPLAGFSPNTEISFWRFPNLLDICPVFLLVFSPLETADFWMLFQPLGDGYSLLCGQKSSFRGTFSFYLLCLLRFENNFLTI